MGEMGMSGKSNCKNMYDNGKTCISIRGGKIYTVDNETGRISDLTICIANGLHVEFGRDIRGYIEALKYTRLPYYFEKKVSYKDIEHYTLSRFSTGPIKSNTLVNIACKNNIIRSISFNRDLNSDTEFKKYVNIPIMNQLSFKAREKESIEEYTKNIKNIMRIVLKHPTDDMEVSESMKEITVTIKKDSGSLNYIFINDGKRGNLYELRGVTAKGNK